MSFLNHDHALIRGLLVGAVVLASASACSRSDRTETGTNNTGTGAIVADTANTQDQSTAVMPPSGDTASAANADSHRATGTANAARAETATPNKESASKPDTASAGYREMERDTSTAEMAAPRDSARVTTDSAVAPGEQSSVTPSDSAPMEVATGVAGAAAVGTAGVAAQQNAAANEAEVERAAADVYDSTTATSEQTDTLAAQTDTATAGQVEDDQKDSHRAGIVGAAAVGAAAASRVGDSDNAARTGDVERTRDAERTGDAERAGDRLDPVVASAEVNDTLTQTEGAPVRPPEDSAEVYGNVNREAAAAAAARTDNVVADEVGAAAIGGNVNGADAVALMTRQGIQCIVVDPESPQGVTVDMSDTPATLNPCGLGSMVLTRIWTKQE